MFGVTEKALPQEQLMNGAQGHNEVRAPHGK